MSSRWLSILGIGEDGVEALSPAARGLIADASLVVGGARHLALAANLITGDSLRWPSPLDQAMPVIVSRRGRPVAVLASGDPFCFGVGSLLAQAVPAEEIICLPAPSSFSLACARLGWALNEVSCLSCCGRPVAALRPHLHHKARLLVLSADATTPAAIAEFLSAHGFGASRIQVLEALGGPRERIRAWRADTMISDDIAALNLVALELVAGPDARILPLTAGLPDEWFAHDGQLTKQDIRAVTLAALAPGCGELLWDVGCGSGAIAIEWLLRHPANRAIAIEARPDRAARAAGNAAALGVPGLELRIGTAPDALADLPPPDAIFIGGGFRAPGLIETAWTALNPGGRLVVNAVTIETEALLFAAHQTHGGSLTRLSVARLDQLGDLHGFRPAMTITQWVVGKPW